MENLIKISDETKLKNKELYKDNVKLEQELLSLLKRPEVQEIVKKDKQEQEEFINAFMDKYVLNEIDTHSNS